MASNQTCFVLAAAYLFWFSVHLNSTLIKGDTAPLFLNSWGFWENSEPSGWIGVIWMASSWLDLDRMEESSSRLVFRLDTRWLVPWITKLQNYKISNHKFPLVGLETSQIANHKFPFLCWPWIISNTKSITNTNHKDFHPRLRIFKSQMPILHWRCLEHILGTGCDGGKSSRNNNWDCRTYRWDWEENNFRPMIVHQQLDWVAIAGIPIIFFTFIILLRWLRNISMSSPPCRKI